MILKYSTMASGRNWWFLPRDRWVTEVLANKGGVSRGWNISQRGVNCPSEELTDISRLGKKIILGSKIAVNLFAESDQPIFLYPIEKSLEIKLDCLLTFSFRENSSTQPHDQVEDPRYRSLLALPYQHWLSHDIS